MAKETKRKVSRPNRPMTQAEIWALINACGSGPAGRRNAAFLALSFGAGLRCAEALKVFPKHIERTPEGVFVLVENGKGNKSRRSGILAEFVPVLDRWLEARKAEGINGHSPIICGITESAQSNVLGGSRNTKGKPITTAAMRMTLRRLAEKAGLEQRVHTHGGRSGHACLLLESGVDLRVIQDQLGHENIATTSRYLGSVSTKQKLQALAKVAPFNQDSQR
jgi:integrase/recombinase XerC